MSQEFEAKALLYRIVLTGVLDWNPTLHEEVSNFLRKDSEIELASSVEPERNEDRLSWFLRQIHQRRSERRMRRQSGYGLLSVICTTGLLFLLLAILTLPVVRENFLQDTVAIRQEIAQYVNRLNQSLRPDSGCKTVVVVKSPRKAGVKRGRERKQID